MRREEKENAGITLVALIITIIVLLILAGVTISLVLGDKGILSNAKEAKIETRGASVEEQANLWKLGNKVAKMQAGIGESLDSILARLLKEKLLEEGEVAKIQEASNIKKEITIGSRTISFLDENAGSVPEEPSNPGKPNDNGIYTENSTINGKDVAYNNPIIPKGFKPVSTADDSSITTTWKKEEETQPDAENGLVIQDDQGNQFVWIPVPDRNKFKRTEGYANGSLQTYSANSGEADSTGINTKVDESETTKAEAIAMYASVNTNKGFYIARFEAGKETVNSVIKAISKRNVPAWTDIAWSNSNTMNTDTGGCVEKARNMYTDKNTYGVTSTLCYGVQWDAALNFIDPNYITNEVGGKPNCQADSYARNSTGKGNYSPNSLANTGSNDNCRVKNIYDMAGNVWEWTMETYNMNNRIDRGGYYGHTGISYPSSYRNGIVPTLTDRSLGYRTTLYL